MASRPDTHDDFCIESYLERDEEQWIAVWVAGAIASPQIAVINLLSRSDFMNGIYASLAKTL
jgi:hypothetical protein